MMDILMLALGSGLFGLAALAAVGIARL